MGVYTARLSAQLTHTGTEIVPLSGARGTTGGTTGGIGRTGLTGLTGLTGATGAPRKDLSFRLFVEEARPSVQLIFLMRFLAGAVLAVGGRFSGLGAPVVVAGIGWVLATLFTYGINGVCDVHEDLVNKTGRPIARGELPPGVAAVWTWLCAAGSVIAMLSTGSTLLTAYGLLFLLLGYAYSAAPFQLKRTAGGASGSVLLMGLLTYAAGWTAAGRTLPTGPDLAVAGAMSLWMAAVGAVTKDFSHVAGDAAAGRRGSVTAWGDGPARLTGAVGALLVAGGFAAVAVHRSTLLGPAACVLLGGAVAVAVLCRTTRGDEARGRTPYRAFMVTQHLVHLTLFAGLGWATP
ncbi:UbiA family prenyltransferase [Streptomyces sp. NPDC086549]|uniref:UbiA family prenyltransferase n=1 Tax=Streptomyces sp. NPDC086549 TaxID=3365752 RepID=UPI003818DCBE